MEGTALGVAAWIRYTAGNDLAGACHPVDDPMADTFATLHADHRGSEALIAALDDLRRDGAVVVIVAQRPSVLVHCSRVLIVDGGRARIIDRRRKADLRVLSNPPAEAASAEVAEFKAAPAKPRKKSGVRK